jgi:hypothetical protein
MAIATHYTAQKWVGKELEKRRESVASSKAQGAMK